MKSEAASKQWDESEQLNQSDLAEEKRQNQAVIDVEEKSAFLVMMKTPQSFETQEAEVE
jgi:hypothetical protein